MLRFLIHLSLWLTGWLFQILYYPFKLMRLLQRRKKCPPIQDDLLLLTAVELARRIRMRQISSEKIITTYIKRIKEVNKILNAVVDDRFPAALVDARNVDAFLIETDFTVDELESNYPLLGVPITVKESIALEGLSFNGGIVGRLRKVAQEDAGVVKRVKEAGAIPLLASNTPELCLNWETVNKHTGRTLNPYDTRRTCGGSTGGEAVLLATGASILGIGSDLSGSIRLPPSFCGVYGHKPSPGSIPIDGNIPRNEGDTERWEQALSNGPMTRYATDLPLLFDVMLKPDKKDNFPPLQIALQKIKIFYMEFDGGSFLTHTVQKSIVRATRTLIERLKFNDFAVKEVNLKRMSDSIDLAFIPLLSIDGLKTVFDDNRNLCCEILKTLVGCSNVQPTTILFAILYSLSKKMLSKERLVKILEEVDELRKEIMAMLGDDGVFLYPVFPTVAHFHGEVYTKTLDTCYLAIFNTLGFPVTSCPIGQSSKGLPIGIQIVANINMDRLCFAIAEEIEKELGGWKQPPFDQQNSK